MRPGQDGDLEANRIAPARAIEDLAGRIEAAYRLRRPGWRADLTSDRIWSAAAATLDQACRGDASIPADPELFVAVQPIDATWGDPWVELVGPRAARRFVRRVHRIIAGLHAELRREVRRAETRVRDGASVESVLLPSNRALSPLGCFIVAHRANRGDLAVRFRRLVEDQHRCCPLYRLASRALLPDGAYPGDADVPALAPATAGAHRATAELN